MVATLHNLNKRIPRVNIAEAFCLSWKYQPTETMHRATSQLGEISDMELGNESRVAGTSRLLCKSNEARRWLVQLFRSFITPRGVVSSVNSTCRVGA